MNPSSRPENKSAAHCSDKKECGNEDPVRPCCVCPETRDLRDKCTFLYGPDAKECQEYIAKHRECLRGYGFNFD